MPTMTLPSSPRAPGLSPLLETPAESGAGAGAAWLAALMGGPSRWIGAVVKQFGRSGALGPASRDELGAEDERDRDEEHDRPDHVDLHRSSALGRAPHVHGEGDR